jgi:hypothetical protein
MTAQQNHDRASQLTYDLLEQFSNEGLSTHESLFAALTILIHACFDMAPKPKAAVGLLGAAMQQAHDRMD